MPTQTSTYFIILHDLVMGNPPRFDPFLKHHGHDLEMAMLKLNDFPSIHSESKDDHWYTLYQVPTEKFNAASICEHFVRSARPSQESKIIPVAIRSGEKSYFFDPVLNKQYKLLLDATPGYPIVRNYSSNELKGIHEYYRMPLVASKHHLKSGAATQKVEMLQRPMPAKRTATDHSKQSPSPKSRSR